MKLIEFINKFTDGKTEVDIFDSWYTDEETIYYTGRIENLTRSPEDYEELLNMFVESIDVGNGYLLILVSKKEMRERSDGIPNEGRF